VSAFGLVLGLVFTGNVVFVHLLGLCPAVSRSRNIGSAFILGCAVTCASTLTSGASWALTRFLLAPFGLLAMRGYAVLLVAAAVGSIADRTARAFLPALHASARTGFPIVTANCAAYGAALLVSGAADSALDSLVGGLAAGMGFFLAVVLLSSIRQRTAVERVPRALRGAPIVIVSAGLIAMAFMAFDASFLARIAP